MQVKKSLSCYARKELHRIFQKLCKKFKVKDVKFKIQKSHCIKGKMVGGSYTYADNTVVIVESLNFYWTAFVMLHEVRHAWQHQRNHNWYAGEAEWDSDNFANIKYKAAFGEEPEFLKDHIKSQLRAYGKYYRKPRS